MTRQDARSTLHSAIKNPHLCFSSPCWDALCATCAYSRLILLLQQRNNSKYVTAVSLNDVRGCAVASRSEGGGRLERTGPGVNYIRLRSKETTRTTQERPGDASAAALLEVFARSSSEVEPTCAARSSCLSRRERCSGGWLWPWCASEARAAACEPTCWAEWSCPGTTGWSCAGGSSSERSSSPAAARAGNAPQRAT